MNKLTLDDLDPRGRRVLVRVDFNVPLRDGEIADDARIVASLPTIRALVASGAKVVLMSHLGRPKGVPDPAFSLEPVAQRLAKLLGQPIRFADDCVGPEALEASEALGEGEVLLLENLRFHQEEVDNDPGFAKQLSQLGDVYVNDAFGTAHRAHASTEGVTRFMSRSAAGKLMERELTYLQGALESPQAPFLAILGGAKVSGKMDVLRNLMKRVDCILIGGGMTYTFYRSRGTAIGDSLVESDRVEMAQGVMETAEKEGVDFVLPVDSIVSTAADGSEAAHPTQGPAIPEGHMGVDVGPKTVELFRGKLAEAKTVVWNGPLGIFEIPEFARATLEIAKAVAEATRRGAVTIVGGGDSVAAIHRLNLAEDDFSHISTGGGAFLEFLEGKELPGVAALTDRP